MWDEAKTNFVAVADSLVTRHPEVYVPLWSYCHTHGVAIFPITRAKNIWVRDWLPVQVNGEFIKFRYGYGKDNPQFPNLKVRREDWKQFLGVRQSSIRLDGGNVQRHGDKAILTDIIFQHNPKLKKETLLARLEKLLQAEITIIPKEPGDDIGHSDGLVHFTPAGKVLVNDFKRMKTRACDLYFSKLAKSLSKLDCELFPYAYHKTPWTSEKTFRKQFPEADTFNPGYGYYINFLVVGKLVFVPKFNLNEDIVALTVLEKHFPKSKIVQVDCSRVSMEGGLINCVTANYVI